MFELSQNPSGLERTERRPAELLKTENDVKMTFDKQEEDGEVASGKTHPKWKKAQTLHLLDRLLIISTVC